MSLNGEPVYDDDAEEFEINGDCAMTEYAGQSGVLEGENPLHPAVWMEFETYEDVYYYYNCYAKQQGFGVRVSNTWYRKSRERYRAKLSCRCAGFKKKTEANRPRPETRTGCPVMIKFRLMENKRWRIIEVELEHNHLISPASGKFYKSYRILGSGSKRPLQIDGPDEAQKIRLFRTVIINAEEDSKLLVNEEGEFEEKDDQFKNQLKLKKGDSQEMLKIFSHMQLMNPNFFYVMDLNEKGCLRNVFWADPKSRAAYGYFGDVVTIDTSCLIRKFEVPLVVFMGMNHHGHPFPLGCGLVSGENVESYVWLFRAWLTYMVGRPPQNIIICEQCKFLQSALTEVFPRASHFLSLTSILEKLPKELGGGELVNYEAIKVSFLKSVCDSTRADEFEAAWENMMDQHAALVHNKWLQTLYEDRKRWVPAYTKESFIAGMFPTDGTERMFSPFNGYLSKSTTLKDFFGSYIQVLQDIDQRETMADIDSRNPNGVLKSTSNFELQLSKLYTNTIFIKFQEEVEGMYSCFSTRRIGTDNNDDSNNSSVIISYTVKENTEVVVNDKRETKEYEVTYNTADTEIVCVCGLFNFKGYLCRHALCVLNQNGVEEIPAQYILSRWRKDVNRSYGFDHGCFCSAIDVNNPVHRYDHLYKCIMKVAEEGRKSRDRYTFTVRALDEILNKLRL